MTAISGLDGQEVRSPSNDRHASGLGPAIAGIVALAAYIRTLLPGMAFGDWGEMQTVPHVLGIAHPTGYPTYVLLAAITELVPIGSVAFRANLLSAVLVAGAVALVAAILVRLEVRVVFAIAVALAFGAVGTVWAAATVAEVNALHLALMALTIERTLVWQQERRARDLALVALLIGLALGNHLLTLFVAPFLVCFVMWAGRTTVRSNPRLLVRSVAAGLIGLAGYA
ncbi:MAG: DUF2723 domain-containing protein, partial [Chloroflexi bacterium]|nr:DUF2723 domain-containing protein [Chloroflexota bacterium]